MTKHNYIDRQPIATNDRIMNEINASSPKSFWIISIVALMWNVLGILTFASDAFMSPEALAALPEAERALYEAVPGWINVVYGIAVLSGTIGSIGLLMKRRWAVPVFLVSLVAIILQMGYGFIFFKNVEVYGAVAIIMPLIIVIIGIYLYYFARQCQQKGWIS